MRPWPSWLRLAWQHPQWLAEHASAYAALAADEGSAAAARLLRQARLQLISGACLVVAATLAGVALMLWAALPVLAGGTAWALVLVPLLPLIGAVWARQRAGREVTDDDFAGLRAQIELDRTALQAWRQGSTSR